MARKNRKGALYAGLATLVKAMSSPHRLELVDLLIQAPRTVEVLARLAGLTVANASQHLQVLWSAGLVEREKEGLFVTYRLASPEVADTVVKLRALAADRDRRLTRVASQLRAKAGPVEEVGAAELLARARRGDVVVLDVRPAEEYAAGHLPFAVSVPLRELKARLAALPQDRLVVAYCRGPYCALAGDAVRVLEEHGFSATAMSEGIAEWRARGHPLEGGPVEV